RGAPRGGRGPAHRPRTRPGKSQPPRRLPRQRRLAADPSARGAEREPRARRPAGPGRTSSRPSLRIRSSRGARLHGPGRGGCAWFNSVVVALAGPSSITWRVIDARPPPPEDRAITSPTLPGAIMTEQAIARSKPRGVASLRTVFAIDALT